MPNIYLRMPTSRCQFFRHRDAERPLAPGQPVVFGIYTSEHFVIRNSLTNASAVIQNVNDQCYSHQQWRNMTNGCHPNGGKVLVPRNKEEYLTFAEVQQLNGVRDYDKTSNMDYLCIKLPYEVEVVDTVRVVTPSWNIGPAGIKKLSTLLNATFKRCVIEWALETFDYCTDGGYITARGQSAMLERFLMRYNIEPSAQEKDSLRRVIERWLKTERVDFSAYSCFDMTYIDTKEHVIRIRDVKWD